MDRQKKNVMVSKKDYKGMVEEHFPAVCRYYILMANRNGEGVWKGEYKSRMNEHIAVLRDCELAKDSKPKLIAKFCSENGYDSVEGMVGVMADLFAANDISHENAISLCGSLINSMSAIVDRIDNVK